MEFTDGPPRCARPVLTGVVAYVEVWSSSRTENYSKSFTQQLIDMGAKVSKTFNKQVTHVIFKEGLSSTWNRAQKAGIKLVSVLWVEKCREAGAHVDESLYPAINTNEGLPQFFKKHKCMQPKDVVRKAPENDRRLQKRIDVLTKELAMQKAATETEAPVLLFKDDGSLVYSPASKIKYQCRAMEKRIKEMKEKRENLSPTASQMSQGSDSSSNPAMHESILVSTSSACALSSGESSDHLNSSFTNLLGNSKSKNLKKESSKCVPEVEGAREVLGSSPVYAGDSKHTTLKESSGKHLRNTFCLEDGLLPTMAKAEMSSAEKHSEMKDCFTAKTGSHLFQTNNDYRLSSESGDNLSMDEVKDGSCEFLCDQVNEPSKKLMSTGRLRKPSRTLVMTSMPSEKQNVVVQVVKKLGGFLFSNEVRDNTSHVIAGSSRRTLNILMGIARGCWILCYEWVLWSLEYGHWMPEEPYELSVDFPAAPICRFQRYLPNREVHQKLFSNHPTMFISPASQPPNKKLCELVQLCGGKVCKTPRQAKICIGEYRVRNNMDIQCLSEKWILDSVTQNKICPPENYKFQKDSLQTRNHLLQTSI
ncbi:microcephalin [Podarcis muralis]